MSAQPECLGLADVFLDPHRLIEAVGVCGPCECRFECAQQAVEDMWVGDNGPEAWVVRGGLFPHEQIDLWRRSAGGKLKGVVAQAVS